MTNPRHALLAAGLAFLLALVVLPTPAAAMEKCSDLGVTTLCVDRTDGACVWATQFDAATDFGTIEKACATLTGDEDSRVACVTTVAGAGTYGGFYGHYQRTCVAVYESQGATCAFAWGQTNDVAWQLSKPLCVA